ncbi:hypothetical protein Zmor_013283 [Zophobas morio]|uniref:Uncharacterized protein n=1 Tax=Zophobas morio TaxID=2755281 RepID=A0AA38MFG2_9CUCU|nr:hypothetical protein Zmor_013283 [Zophobas morio]
MLSVVAKSQYKIENVAVGVRVQPEIITSSSQIIARRNERRIKRTKKRSVRASGPICRCSAEPELFMRWRPDGRRRVYFGTLIEGKEFLKWAARLFTREGKIARFYRALPPQMSTCP